MWYWTLKDSANLFSMMFNINSISLVELFSSGIYLVVCYVEMPIIETHSGNPTKIPLFECLLFDFFIEDFGDFGLIKFDALLRLKSLFIYASNSCKHSLWLSLIVISNTNIVQITTTRFQGKIASKLYTKENGVAFVGVRTVVWYAYRHLPSFHANLLSFAGQVSLVFWSFTWLNACAKPFAEGCKLLMWCF